MKSTYQAILEARQKLAAKHLPGRHNQQTHGKGGGGLGAGRPENPAEAILVRLRGN